MARKSPIVLMHVVWMPTYTGWEDGMYAGGFEYPKQNGECGEIFNFKPHRGRVYGHVQMSGKTVKISRLGAAPDDKEVDGITVVWTAPNPFADGRLVVGWYKNATVHADLVTPEGRLAEARTHEGNVYTYQVSAAADDMVSIPVEQRVFSILPKKRGQRGVPGQSPLFYISDQDSADARKLESRLREYVDTGRPPRGGKVVGKKSKQDVERKNRIERTAQALVEQHFKEQGYHVDDVSDDDRGYDLTATLGDVTLCIEVKGRSLDDVYVQFTPNEYDAIRRQERREFAEGNYRICIVTDALGEGDGAKLHHYSCWAITPKSGVWRTTDGSARLHFDEVVGAKARGRPTA